MNMKKTLALCLTIAICATMALGGTLAYLTDTEEEVNIMTLGRVDIELHEKQRGDEGLENFQDGKPLLPIVGDAQGDKDEYGLPTAANYVDKIITVSNKALSSDAWVRLLIAFPQGMDADLAKDMPLHWNQGNKYVGDGQYTPDTYASDWKAVDTDEDVQIDDIWYNIYSFTYQHKLQPGHETNTAAIVGFYLDKRVDWDDETETYFLLKADGTKVPVTGIGPDGSVRIPVVAQAVQASGFASADIAFGPDGANMTLNPWEGKSYADVVMVRTQDEFMAVAATPGTVATLAQDITVDKQIELLPGASINGNGKTVNSALYFAENQTTEPAILATEGVVENISVIGPGRGVGTRHDLTGDLILNNIHVNGGSYGLNVGSGAGHKLVVENSFLYGWVSFGTGFESVIFNNVQFGKGESGANTIRPWQNVTFESCDFGDAKIDLEDTKLNSITEIKLINCTMNGGQPINLDALLEEADEVEKFVIE